MQDTRARNRDVLVRRAAGESLTSIHRSYPGVTYGRIVDVARDFREKFLHAVDAGSSTTSIAAEWSIPERAVAEMVDQARKARADLMARHAALEAEREREITEWEEEIAEARRTQDTLSVNEPYVGSALIQMADLSGLIEAADALREKGWEVIAVTAQDDGQARAELKLARLASEPT